MPEIVEDVAMEEKEDQVQRSSMASKTESEGTFAHPRSKKRRRSTTPECPPDARRTKRKKPNEEEQTGASYVRYEKTQDRNGKTKVQPVRYSIRNDGAPKEGIPLEHGVDESFIYEPNEMEKLFTMSNETKSVR